MRALYEINADLDELLTNVDPETGELLIDPEALDELMLEREEKLEGIALAVKNADAEAKAIKAEEDALAERRRRIEKRRDGLRDFLQQSLAGEKLETPRVAVSYRRSKALEVNEAVFWPWAADYPYYIRRKDPEIDKKKITDAIKDGAEIPGAALVERVSMTIK